VKETHREPSDLQSFAAATEDGNVTCVGNATDDAVDIAAVDTLNRITEIADDAREKTRVRKHKIYPCFNAVSVRGTLLVARVTGLDETPDLCSRKAKSPPILFWCAFFQVGTEHCRIGDTPDGGRQVSFSVKKQTSRSEALNAGDVEQVVRMYTNDALVLGILSPGMTSRPDDLRAYFKAAADAKLQVKLGDHSAIAVADDAVAIAGFYDFSRPAADGQPVVIAARFSFVMVKKDGIWKIALHHSSVRPKSPL